MRGHSRTNCNEVLCEAHKGIGQLFGMKLQYYRCYTFEGGNNEDVSDMVDVDVSCKPSVIHFHLIICIPDVFYFFLLVGVAMGIPQSFSP